MAGNISIFRRMQMKSIKKLIFVLAALTAVFGFVACSDDDDEPSTVAVYEESYTESGVAYTETITFLDNGTFKNVGTIGGKSYTFATGTYKGDVKKDTSDSNKVTFTVEKMMYLDLKLYSLKDYAEKIASSMAGLVTADEIIKEYTNAPATIKDGVLDCEMGTYTLKK